MVIALFWCTLNSVTAATFAHGEAFATLSTEALHLDGEARIAESHSPIAENRTRLELYVGSDAKSVIIQSVTLRVDDAPQFSYEYNEDESAALQRGGLHPLLNTELERGDHHLNVKIVAREKDATYDVLLVGRLDDTVSLADAVSRLELRFSNRGFMNLFRGASVEIASWSPAP